MFNQIQDVMLVVDIALRAGQKLKDLYLSIEDEKFLNIQIKRDESPVTIADKLSSELITHELTLLTPNLRIICEEGRLSEHHPPFRDEYYWLVDPLDGTREFIQKTDDFSINIALMKNAQPYLGVVHIPMEGVTYLACTSVGAYKYAPNLGNSLIPIRTKRAQTPYALIISRRHGLEAVKERLSARLSECTIGYRGSAIKGCLIAEGLYDCYPRIGPTSEWDTAAVHCILQCAGGDIITLDQRSLTYNQQANFLNPNFLAVGDLSIDWIGWLGITV